MKVTSLALLHGGEGSSCVSIDVGVSKAWPDLHKRFRLPTVKRPSTACMVLDGSYRLFEEDMKADGEILESNEEKVRFVLWEERKTRAADANPSRTVWGLENTPRVLLSLV